MDKWIRAATLPATVDLAALSGFLHQHKIVHRISEEQGQQVIWVTSAEVIAPLNELLDKLRSGAVRVEAQHPGADSRPPEPGVGRRLGRALVEHPATFVLLGLSFLGYVVAGTEIRAGLLHWFTFQDFVVRDRFLHFVPVLQSWLGGEIWRPLTPMFLHFNIFHIVFNGLWLWEFGRRIEALTGHWQFINLVLVIGVVSNTSEFLWQGASLFGGMSGVIYGLLGYIWQRHRLAPHPLLAIAPGIISFMLLWLVLCMLGTVSWLTHAAIANAAHLGGLVTGMFWGVLAGSKARGGGG